MKKNKERDMFVCKKKDTGECVKNMIGDPECEFCQNYLECTQCYRFNTKFCDRCTIALLRQSFDMSN